jgi:hypothetical protein
MTPSRLVSPRPRGEKGVAVALGIALALTACGSFDASATPTPLAASATPSATATPAPTPEPTPSPSPTARFTNEPDPELGALIPLEVAGIPVVVAPFEEFALTPGDVGTAYGELGNRFASLALAYIERPRLSLYAVRVEGEPVTTAELRPHLATAGRYVGIAGLDPDPWETAVVGSTQVWVRPEDNATAAGTHIYTWSSGEYVFLLIGVDDAVNRAMIEALPGEPAPTPSPTPTVRASPPVSPSTDPSASPGG